VTNVYADFQQEVDFPGFERLQPNHCLMMTMI
jgi:hypothetical protein